MTNKVYDVLKYIALIGLPALTAFYGVVGATFNIPLTQEVITVLIAANACLGSLLGISTIKYNRDQQ